MQIRRVEEFWHWATHNLTSAIRARRYYDMPPEYGALFEPFGERGLMSDHINRLLGHVMLRQVRVLSGTIDYA